MPNSELRSRAAARLLGRLETYVERANRIVGWASRVGVVRDKWVRRAAFQRYPFYWQLRARAVRARFEISRRRYGIGHSQRERRLSANVGLQILRAVFPPAVVALAMVLALRGLDVFLARYSLPSALAVLDPVLNRDRFQQDPGALSNLYSTTAQIAGVFVGLYFTALSLLASTSYRDVPADLRKVVIEERAGLLYLRVVALTGAAALYCLGMQSIGVSPGILNAAGLTVLSSLSVLSFVLLGIRSFTFFDPSALAAYLTAQILDAARAATPQGFGWNDPSFQAHQQKLASQSAASLRRLVAVTATGPLAGRGLREIASRALLTIEHYANLRVEIPHESHWFERTADHQSWLTASESQLTLAVRSGGGMQPSEKPDELWLDRQLADTVVDATRELLARSEYREVALLGQSVTGVLDGLASQFQLESAEYLEAAYARLATRLLDDLAAANESESSLHGSAGPASDQQRLFQLAALDGTIAGPCAIIPGIGRAAREVTPQVIQKLARGSSQAPVGAPISAAVPAHVRAMLHSLRRNLAFEREVEGALVTPDAGRADLIARSYSAAISRAVELVLEVARRAYLVRQAKAFRSDSGTAPDAVVTIIQRGFESIQKLRAHASAMADTVSRLSTLQLAFDDTKWETVDLTSVTERLEGIEAELVRALADVAPRLPAVRDSNHLPDSFGYAFTTLVSEAFQALLDGRCDTFAYVFRTILPMSLLAHDRVLAETPRGETEARFRYSSDLLLDLTDLSGYAYLIDNCTNGGTWAPVVDAWNTLFARVPAPDALLQSIVMEENLRSQPSFSITPRELLRTTWRQQFDRWLEKQGFTSQRDYFYSGSTDDQVLRVPIDTISHTFVRRGGLGEQPRDVFFASYLKGRIEAGGLSLPPGATHILDSAVRLKRQREEARDGRGPLSALWSSLGILASFAEADAEDADTDETGDESNSDSEDDSSRTNESSSGSGRPDGDEEA